MKGIDEPLYDSDGRIVAPVIKEDERHTIDQKARKPRLERTVTTPDTEQLKVGSKRKGSPNGVRNDRRLQILRTAANHFLERGFESTSLDDIAGALDITRSALYYYFKSKQHLLAAIIDHAQERHEALLREIMTTSTTDEELLRRTVHIYALSITNSDDAAFSLLGIEEIRHLLPADRRRITDRKRAYIDFLRGTLDRLKATGRLHDVDTTAAAHSLAAIVAWIPKWYRPGGRLSPRQVADEITRLALFIMTGDENSRLDRFDADSLDLTANLESITPP